MSFRPHDIAQQFPTPLAPDLDPRTALAFAAADFRNAIEISQPEDPLASDRENAPMALSHLFTVQDYFIKDFFKTEAAMARDKEYGKCKMGVGVGVGVGGPRLDGHGGSAWLEYRQEEWQQSRCEAVRARA